LLLAGFAIGCGSGDDEPSQPAGVAGSATTGGSKAVEKQPNTTRPIRDAGTEKAPPSRPVAGTDESRGKAEAAEPQGGAAEPQGNSRGGVSATVRADADSCVERFGYATCAAMAKPAGGPSRSVEKPADCMLVMTKRECEELAAAQESARGHDESVNVEKCIENPTPHCEDVLRPLLEAHGATSRGAGQ
jgi:hypothetical protein